METEIRVVAAVVHNETNEVEIIIEKTKALTNFKDRTTLHSVWINCEKELDNLPVGRV